MEKLFRPKDYLLLGLALLGDLYFYIAEPISLSLKKLHGILPSNYPASNFYGVVKRMYKTKEIKKIIDKDKVYFCLTGEGKTSLKRKFPLLSLQAHKWDGLWRVVIFDIAEKDKIIRNLLRQKLKNLGFGMWQKSVYISPFNVAEEIRDFLIAKGLKDQAYVLVSKRLYAGDEKELAAKVWPLDIINKTYEELIDEWEWVKARIEETKHQGKARECYFKYLKIITQDPFLPKELLPINWQGRDLQHYVKEWLKLLTWNL